MSEIPTELNPTQSSSSRSARLEDFFGGDTCQPKYDKIQNDKNSIEKNQQNFGNRKRIKP